MTIGWCFDNTYYKLPNSFKENIKPIPVKKPELIILNKNLTKVEKIKKFFISEEKFSIENGMQTPTMKLKRYKIIQKFKNKFESLY